MWNQSQFQWLAEKRYNKFSQWGEDGLLEAIFDRIGTANKWVMECGAADGIFFSNSRKLIEEGWSAVLGEYDLAQFRKAEKLYSDNPNVHVRCGRAVSVISFAGQNQEFTLDRLMENVGAPLDIDLAVIDVDSTDYWLFNSLLKYRPRVVMIEYDPAAEKDFIPPQDGEGQAGLNAICALGIGKYYWPVAITQTNVIFVPQELCGKLADDAIGSDTCTAMGQGAKTPRAPKLAAIMSSPRLGFLATMDCIYSGLMPLGVPLLRGEGAYWHQTLERAIEKAISEGAEYVLTFDYDVVFDSKHGSNDIAKLVCLMEDNPDVDCIVSAQMKREKGALLASSEKEIRLLDPLVPITVGHFGLTIFKASALQKIPKPWLRDFPNDDGEWGKDRIDADIWFWKQAVAAGLNIQMSLDVMIGHLELVVTWPGQNMQTVYQSLTEWREHGRPAESFHRQRVIDAVKANPALLYGPKLEMGD